MQLISKTKAIGNIIMKGGKAVKKTATKRMKKRTVQLGTLLPLTVLIISASLSGCAPHKDTKETGQFATDSVVRETEAGTEQHTETEPITEAALSLRDIQVSIKTAGRSGNMEYQILDPDGEESGTCKFYDSKEAFMAEDGNGCFAYSDKNETMALDRGAWYAEDVKYMNVWDTVYSEDSKLMDDTVIDGTECYHISSESDDEPGGLISICNAHGYRNVINGTCRYDFYISKETMEIVRMDVEMSYLGDKNGSSETGSFTASFTTSELKDQEIERPEVEIVSDTEEYTAGTLGDNLYSNDQFGIRIAGKDLFTFNAERTSELEESYKSMNSRYMEEAYGEGNGVIVNISSIASGADTKENIMAKYLQDSNASGIQAAPVITVGTNEYAASTADINGTMTKTYCTSCDGRCLVITIYYSELSAPEVFEGNLFGPEDDPNWTPQDWTLLGKYTVTTPDGYNVVNEDSSDIFVCMKDDSNEVNVFAIEGTTVDNEAQSESASTDTTSKNVQNQSDIVLDDGSSMKYLEIYNVEAEASYYTYIGLLQKDTAVIKIYVVSTAQADFTGIFHDFANRVMSNSNTGILESETGMPEQN